MPTQEETLSQAEAFLAAQENNVIPTYEDAPFEAPVETTSPAAPVETPIAETAPVAEIVETIAMPDPVVVPEPQVIEKTVEKIIEKYPEMDEHSQRIFNAIKEGKEDELFDYLNEKRKDYITMSDYDVVKEGLKKQNPKWSERDVQLELKSKYGSLSGKKDLSEIDKETYPEEYERALAFNEALEQRETLLARDARDARIYLDEQKKTIQFPTIEQPVTPAANAPTQEEIDALNRQWEELVTSEVPKLGDLKYTVGGEEVIYKITEDDKSALQDSMKGFDVTSYLSKRGWFDENGNPNVLKITEDVYKLDNQEKLISSMATQLKTAATKQVIANDIKNLDTETSSRESVGAPKKSWEETAFMAGRNN